jgi:triacylglycerol esterase/lipase EstA (alpha/beta hydrolase family)
LTASAAILNSTKPVQTNDGLVPVASTRWGTFLGCIPADHLDEICQIAGDQPGGSNSFDCERFYRQLADWLVARGY